MPRHMSLQTPTLLASVFLALAIPRSSAQTVDLFDGDHEHYNNRPDAGLFEPGPAYDQGGSQYESGLKKRAEQAKTQKFSTELIFAIVFAILVGAVFLVAGILVIIRRYRQRQRQQRLPSTAAQVLGRDRSLSDSKLRVPQGRQPLAVFIDVDTHVAGTNSIISAGPEKGGSPLVAMLRSPFTKKGPRPTSSFLLPFESEKPQRRSRLHKSRSPSVSPREWSPPRPMKDDQAFKIELDFDGDVTEQDQDLHHHQQRERDEKPVLKVTIHDPPPALSLTIPSDLPKSAPATTPIDSPWTAANTPTTAIDSYSLRAPSPGPAMTPISPVAETLSVAHTIGIASATARRFTFTEGMTVVAPTESLPSVPTLRYPVPPLPRSTNRNSRSLARDVVERNMFARAQAEQTPEPEDAAPEEIQPGQLTLATAPQDPNHVLPLPRQSRGSTQVRPAALTEAVDYEIGVAY